MTEKTTTQTTTETTTEGGAAQQSPQARTRTETRPGQPAVADPRAAADGQSQNPPIVDPSPTAAPIAVDRRSYAELLKFHPAPASPPEVLELEPNRYEDAVSGPDEQISPTTYVHMRKPDGTEFITPLANVPYYEGKGYSRGAEEEIPDLVAYLAEQAKRDPHAGR